jgi:hypothetical protein
MVFTAISVKECEPIEQPDWRRGVNVQGAILAHDCPFRGSYLTHLLETTRTAIPTYAARPGLHASLHSTLLP